MEIETHSARVVEIGELSQEKKTEGPFERCRIVNLFALIHVFMKYPHFNYVPNVMLCFIVLENERIPQ